ncbi:MAG: RNA 2',3'-cyclic phosphodiesterase [Anaerolineales bacterium]|jgi:2'-5' RNA ligase
MSVIRAFIALDLPIEVQECLDQVSERLEKPLADVPIRWVPAKNIHLTLKFLGDVSVNNLEVLTKMLEVEVVAHHEFQISVGGIGAFPKIRRPRVIWIGVEAPSELISLQRSIESQTAKLGYAKDRRSFSPHLTLGRVSRNATPREVRKIGNLLNETKIGFLGVAPVKEVHLYRSDLKPGGAVYTRLFSTSLGKQGIEVVE